MPYQALECDGVHMAYPERRLQHAVDAVRVQARKKIGYIGYDDVAWTQCIAQTLRRLLETAITVFSENIRPSGSGAKRYE